MNIMQLNDYRPMAEYDPELDQFRGEVLGPSSSADFYDNSPTELWREFKNSLKVFLDVCEENEIETTIGFSGKFNLRINPKLHTEIAARASGENTSGENKSINQWVGETLENSIGQ